MNETGKKSIVPEGDGDSSPLSIRYPSALVKRIDAIAKQTKNTRTDTIIYLLKWAVATQEAQTRDEQGAAKSA